MGDIVQGHTVSRLCRKCARCCPYPRFHAYTSCSDDHRDHRDLRLVFSIPPGRQKPSNLILLV